MFLSRADSGNEDLHSRRADGTGSETKLLDMPRPVFEVVPTRAYPQAKRKTHTVFVATRPGKAAVA